MYHIEKGVLENSSFFSHTPSNTARAAPFHLTYAGEFFCNAEYRVDRQNFHSYLLMYIRAGSGVVTVENRTWAVRANDVVLLDCHRPHLYYTTVGWEILWIHFEGNACPGFFGILADRCGLVLPMGDSSLIHRQLELIIDGFRHDRPVPEILLGSHIHRMLVELYLVSAGTTEASEFRISPAQEAIGLIHLNYAQKISVEDLARQVNLSPFHFSRLFKKETGYAPYEYVIKTRIDQAKNRLKQTRLTVKEIAYAVGFNSEANFVKTFHNAVAMTPQVFRNTPV